MGKNGYTYKILQSENSMILKSENIVIPKMATIHETALLTGFPENALRRLVKDEKIVFVKAGNRVFINVEKFIEYLNSGEGNGGGEKNG